jgi:hypothetical protein
MSEYPGCSRTTDGDNKGGSTRPCFTGRSIIRAHTHGNQASFRRGFDGLAPRDSTVYNNDSHVKGKDGHQVDLNSGNTYRLRLEGTRIEHYNPMDRSIRFGLAFDPFGNLFSSDCLASEPLYQLLVDGYYPSFGKPHDGLGVSRPR